MQLVSDTVEETGRVRTQYGDLAVVQIHDVLGMAHERRDVGGEEILPDAEADDQTLADVLPQEAVSPDVLDEDWRQAILESAMDHVLNKTALSQRDRAVYREYVQEGRPIEEVAAKYGISRNFVSQIKTRINRRIVMVGQELIAGLGRV